MPTYLGAAPGRESSHLGGGGPIRLPPGGPGEADRAEPRRLATWLAMQINAHL